MRLLRRSLLRLALLASASLLLFPFAGSAQPRLSSIFWRAWYWLGPLGGVAEGVCRRSTFRGTSGDVVPMWYLCAALYWLGRYVSG